MIILVSINGMTFRMKLLIRHLAHIYAAMMWHIKNDTLEDGIGAAMSRPACTRRVAVRSSLCHNARRIMQENGKAANCEIFLPP